ncbi:MAG: NlpC/P60 family protein [Negativicoccus succinicivorans]|nr:NlpC/P60 family protein [Negativicoccus succinicivorans]
MIKGIPEKAGDRLADAALTWLGTPYVHNAKAKGYGADCGHLAIGAAEDAGIIKKNSVNAPNLATDWHLHKNREIMRELVAAYCIEVTGKPLMRGDILLYQYGRVSSHVGIYIGNNEVIHSYVGRGVVVSPITDTLFFMRNGTSRLRHVFRLGGE